MNILFVTWDGPQTSYLESLFIPIFSNLAKYGYTFHILQFTWANSNHISKIKSVCEENGIKFRSAPIDRRFGAFGPLTSAVSGRRHVDKAIKDWKIDALMPRSLMPSLSVLLARGSKGVRQIFDADGFVADERVDFGNLSRRSLTYRLLRIIEAKMTRNADTVLARTPKAIEILCERSGCAPEKFFVVSNGRDSAPYILDVNTKRGKEFTLCYAGSLGSKYCVDEMIDLATYLHKHLPSLVFKVFTGDAHALTEALDRLGVENREWIKVSYLPAEQMPKALMECDLGLVFIKSAFSTQGVVPIKLGEYMLAGLPVIGTEGIGPVGPLIEAGVMFPIQDDISKVLPWVRDQVMPHRVALRKRAHTLGLANFSLQSSVDSYLRALRRE